MKTLLLTLLLAAPAFADHHSEPNVAPSNQDSAPEELDTSGALDQKLPAGLPATLETAALEKAGFAPLFNGKDLSGWRKTGGTASFEVKDDAIRGFGTDIKGNTFLRSEKEYSDFIFVFQFKLVDKNGNSGCMFRALHKKATEKNPDGRVMGYQCEHDNFKNPQRSWTAGLFDEARRRWLFPHQDATPEVKAAFTEQGEKLYKWDDWNTVVIKCEGKTIQTFLNGELRVDFTDDDEEHFTPTGFFGLQVHGGKSGDILWKNLYLKEL